jgi:hypothetical protein
VDYKPYCLVSGVLFGLVALGHLLRIVFRVPLDVGGISIPMWVSWFGTIVPGALSIWAWRIARGTKAAG